jgi:hypothetical protein
MSTTTVSREEFFGKYDTTESGCGCPSMEYRPDGICKHMKVLAGMIPFTQEIANNPRPIDVYRGVGGWRAQAMLGVCNFSQKEVLQYKNELDGRVGTPWARRTIYCDDIRRYSLRGSYKATATSCLCPSHSRNSGKACKHMKRVLYLATLPN